MSLVSVFLASKLAAGALAAGALLVGGTGAAAYTGNLPGPLQQSAHDLIGAPGPRSDHARPDTASTATRDGDDAPSSNATAKGPDASGPAAFGLCHAYAAGGLDPKSTAFTALADAAKGASNITAYCRTITAPGRSASHRADTGHANPSRKEHGRPDNGTSGNTPAQPAPSGTAPTSGPSGDNRS
jgi:hypothetical protein